MVNIKQFSKQTNIFTCPSIQSCLWATSSSSWRFVHFFRYWLQMVWAPSVERTRQQRTLANKSAHDIKVPRERLESSTFSRYCDVIDNQTAQRRVKSERPDGNHAVKFFWLHIFHLWLYKCYKLHFNELTLFPKSESKQEPRLSIINFVSLCVTPKKKLKMLDY